MKSGLGGPVQKVAFRVALTRPKIPEFVGSEINKPAICKPNPTLTKPFPINPLPPVKLFSINTSALMATEEAKIDLFEDDDEFEEFEIGQEWEDKEEGKEVIVTQQWEDDWDDDDVNDDFSLQLRRELESNPEKK